MIQVQVMEESSVEWTCECGEKMLFSRPASIPVALLHPGFEPTGEVYTHVIRPCPACNRFGGVSWKTPAAEMVSKAS